MLEDRSSFYKIIYKLFVHNVFFFFFGTFLNDNIANAVSIGTLTALAMLATTVADKALAAN